VIEKKNHIAFVICTFAIAFLLLSLRVSIGYEMFVILLLLLQFVKLALQQFSSFCKFNPLFERKKSMNFTFINVRKNYTPPPPKENFFVKVLKVTKVACKCFPALLLFSLKIKIFFDVFNFKCFQRFNSLTLYLSLYIMFFSSESGLY